jgi:RNA polymerase sigma factor (sigma-70 family)
MMTNELPTETQITDVELVARSCDGNREAFAGIVTRYQTLLCSLTFSICGNVHQSEELAQETFLTAWRQLPGLKEPGKLKSWLCGIARNLAHNAMRRQRHVPTARAEALNEDFPGASRTPCDEASMRDEAAILWKALEDLPENYREPMILFYREGESVRVVAECLDLSEDAVKQRLARGRVMLAEHIERALGSALRETAPGSAFSVGVLAALPAMELSAKAAKVAVTTVKGSGAAKGAGVLAALTGAMAAAGAAFAIWGRVRSARSDRERKFLKCAYWGFAVWIYAFIAGGRMIGGGNIIINGYHDAVKWLLLWIGAIGVWTAYSIWMNNQAKRIRIEDGTWTSARDFLDGAPSRTGLRATAYGGLAAIIFGIGGVLILAARTAGDNFTAVLLSLLAGLTWIFSARAIIHRPERRWGIFMSVYAGLALLLPVVCGLRMAAWSTEHRFELDPFVLFDFEVIIFIGAIMAGSWLKRHFILTNHFKRDAVIAATFFACVVMSGAVFVNWR